MAPPDSVALMSSSGCELHIAAYGATVTRLVARDKKGVLRDVALGLDNLESYRVSPSYFGATVGRFANRIAGGRFTLAGREILLDRNEGRNILHGGRVGFSRKLWQITRRNTANATLALTSEDGDMGFPAQVDAVASYKLLPEGGFQVEYEARASAPTMVSIANHTYFNLDGEGQGDIREHQLQVSAEHFLPIGVDLIPTGSVEPVQGSAMDLRQPHKIGEILRADEPQIAFHKGLDHNFCLARQPRNLTRVARVFSCRSGLQLEVSTTAPGLQVYTGNVLDGSEHRGPLRHERYAGLCLEAQAWPDAPNRSHFPSSLLLPGELYRSVTCYRLSLV